MATSLKLINASKGKPFRLEESLRNKEKIGLKKAIVWAGWYNIRKEQTWRWTDGGNPIEETIEPGNYTFDELSKVIAEKIDGLTITLDERTGKMEMTIPSGKSIQFPERIHQVFGIDLPKGQTNYKYWMGAGVLDGNRPVELSPKRILVYLNQLSTTNNLVGDSNRQVDGTTITGSQLLEIIPISNVHFGEGYTVQNEKPSFLKLTSTIHEFDFDFKLDWGNGGKEKLDNHGLPIDLDLEIR